MAKVYLSKSVSKSWTGQTFYGFQRIKPLRNGGKVMMVPEEAPLRFIPQNQVNGFAWAEVDDNAHNRELVCQQVETGNFYMEDPDILDLTDGELTGLWKRKTAYDDATDAELAEATSELRATYQELFKKEVANNKKNDADWMKAKIDEKLKED